jgi:D-sedoheptulose 7-phosphate isomerase
MDNQLLMARSRQELLRRNRVFDAFFGPNAERLAIACHDMAGRFQAGGRLLAFGTGAAATDAQHVSVEFVHPVIVGKRALPALDLGLDFEARLPTLVRRGDMVMGFAFTPADPAVTAALEVARASGALTFGLSAPNADYAFPLPDDDPFVCQEVFEGLYHLLWETVHVYFEHREQGHDVGAAAFLYPFLGENRQPLEDVVAAVQGSMRQKVAEVNWLRAEAAETEPKAIVEIARRIVERFRRGGQLLAFGNGGSATDANDFAADCLMPPRGWAPVSAMSLAAEPAVSTAIANDIGAEAVFARQIIAHGRPADIAIAISTSGNSPNIIAALAEARKRDLLTVAIVGYGGGRIVSERLADAALIVRSDYIPRIQEVQASLYHVLRARIADLMLTDYAHA